MQRLHGNYAQTFNERRDRTGHVFQGRFGSVRMASDEHLWAAAAYFEGLGGDPQARYAAMTRSAMSSLA